MPKPNKFIVITSIFEPTEAVKQFANAEGWQLIVVGDKKSPPSWEQDGVIYLGPADQEKLGFSILKELPWNHYCRKMVGYLYAMREGAEIIYDTDDDNLPKSNWPSLPPAKGEYSTLHGQKFVNIYSYFSDEFIWPRGYPLKNILSKARADTRQESQRIGIWQFLADGDPDVDAIYRLTNNKEIYFKNTPPLVLDEGTVCPFNSQNTIFYKELFPLLYLPAFVTFRFTDILRGLVAQPILWESGYRLGFGAATVVQERNPHDYLRDFESEIPVYLHAEEVIDITLEALGKSSGDLLDQLPYVYAALHAKKIVTNDEIRLLNSWLKDIKLLQNMSS
jgi:hypothetical protein